MLTGKINPSINSSKIYRSNRTIFEGALTVAEVVISTSREAKGRDGKEGKPEPSPTFAGRDLRIPTNKPSGQVFGPENSHVFTTFLQHAERKSRSSSSVDSRFHITWYSSSSLFRQTIPCNKSYNSPFLSLSFKKNRNNRRRREGKFGFDPSALNFNILIRSRYRYISSLTLRISIP